MKNALYLSASAILCCGAISCSSLPPAANPDIAASVTKLTAQTETLQTVVKAETDNAVLVRRDEAIRYWIKNGNVADGNLHRDNPSRSFANWVCAGSGSLTNAQVDMAYFNAYSGALQGQVDPGPDTFSGQFSRFLKDSPVDLTIAEPEAPLTPGQAFNKCVVETMSLVHDYEAGRAADDFTTEFGVSELLGSLKAGQALFDGLKTMAKDGLRLANDVKARARLKTFFEANDEQLIATFEHFQNSSKLDEAWERRKAFVLGSSYDAFRTILSDPNPKANATKIRAAAMALSSQLTSYDAMTRTKKPSEVAKIWIRSVGEVRNAVFSDKVSITGLVAYLEAADKQMKQIKKDYEDVDSKFDALSSALSAR